MPSVEPPGLETDSSLRQDFSGANRDAVEDAATAREEPEDSRTGGQDSEHAEDDDLLCELKAVINRKFDELLK